MNGNDSRTNGGMMKSAAAVTLLFFVLVGAPVLAQDRTTEATLWGSYVDIDSTDLADGFSVSNEDGKGFGVSANYFLGKHFSIETSVFALKGETELLLDGLAPVGDDEEEDAAGWEMGRLTIVPITIGLQFHLLGDSNWDIYVGAGGAYVSASNFTSDDLDTLGIGIIEVDSEFSYYGNVGLGVMFNENFGITLDARYINYEPTTLSRATGETQDLELSPMMGSLGIKMRF